MVFYCCVCRNNSEINKEMSFFRFPGNPEMKLKWIKNISLKIKDFYPPYPSSRICSAHFTESQLVKNKRNRVLKSALPTADGYEPATENEGDELVTEEPDGNEHATEKNDEDEYDVEEIEEDEILMDDSLHKEHGTPAPVPSDDLPTDRMIINDDNMDIFQNEKLVVKKEPAFIPSKSVKKRPEVVAVKYSRKCDHCVPPHIFHNQVDFILHQLNHVETFNKKCDVCKMKFSKSTDLSKHKELHNRPKTYDCTECFSKFRTPERLKIHENVHSKEIKYFCDYCSYKTYRLFSLQKHKELHDRPKTYDCTECRSIFETPERLKVHKNVHIKVMKYFCDYCSYKTHLLFNLQMHKVKHTREKKYFCKECPFSTHRPYAIKRHVKVRHDKANENGSVNRGPKLRIDSVNENGRLNRGPKLVITEFADDIEILENSDKKFKCKICDKQFPIKTKVVEHIRRHKDVKPYACDICSYRFVNLASLKSHRTIHSDERKYLCKLCPFKAKNHVMLSYHRIKKHRPVNQSQ